MACERLPSKSLRKNAEMILFSFSFFRYLLASSSEGPYCARADRSSMRGALSLQLVRSKTLLNEPLLAGVSRAQPLSAEHPRLTGHSQSPCRRAREKEKNTARMESETEPKCENRAKRVRRQTAMSTHSIDLRSEAKRACGCR